MPPKLPKLTLRLPPNPVQPIRQILRESHEQVEKAKNDIRSIAGELHGLTGTAPVMPLIAPERQNEPPVSQSPMSTIATAARGTACLPCSRDHLSTSSSALSEGVRFAREKGVRDPEAVRRIRIALDELNIMERIDLAPDEIVGLKGAEKELAGWTLKQSRELRHDITAIKDAETMEKTAARASGIADEFMSRLGSIPEEECETCEQARESLRNFIEKRRRK